MGYRLTSTPLGVGLVAGLVIGSATGLAGLTASGSAAVALLLGAVAATAFGLLAGSKARRPSAALSGLPAADRATVIKTMRKGGSTVDRRLAPAVVAYADEVRRGNERWATTPGTRRMLLALAGFQAASTVYAAFEGDWVGVVLRMPIVAAILMIPHWARQTGERLEQVERSAQVLLDRPLT